MSIKYVYSFKDGNKDMKSLLGGKGANLGEMTSLGLNVPSGFTITTEACNRFYDEGEILWDSLKSEIKQNIELIEKELDKKFSDNENPLLFSVRSGAVFSMPGMMDTVLNLGLNDQAVIGLAHATSNERFAYDSYRRFIQMFADVAMDISIDKFEALLEKAKKEAGVETDSELNVDELKELITQYKALYKKETGHDFPQDPMEQLYLSTEAVFRSWNNDRAKVYRKMHDISDDLGTAVNIQSMVFGNMGETSGTGVAFTRNPSTGAKGLFGEYLINAQGEDVVAGVRTPEDINHLKEQMPEAYDEFTRICEELEKHYQDMQDLEFTIEDGKLYILQTRNGKRTTQAAVNIAVDMVNEGLLTPEEAIMKVEPNTLSQLLHPTFDPAVLAEKDVVATGLAASPGAVSGKIYFHSDDSVHASENGEKVIIVRQVTSPEDLAGMAAAEGILTSRGGMTSHAAVVARGMGKCCVAGASEIRVDEHNKTMRIDGKTYHEGDLISLDGSTGHVYEGVIQRVEPELVGKFETFMDWVEKIKTLGVRANADSPVDTRAALNFGAEGVGLCRTEHMFFNADRILSVRQMILSDNKEDRMKALAKILPYQEEDFYEMFKTLGDRPITIRLLDPPLHEFIPQSEEEIQKLAKDLDLEYEFVKDRVTGLYEVNPMLGHRGCRLAVTYPEIYRMQTRAILQAALRIKNEGGYIQPEIMIPLVVDPKEVQYVKDEMLAEVALVFEEHGEETDYLIGSMIEIPRAALLADEMAEKSEFFSFGTNDMTQMGFGFSRDDAGKFLTEYEEKGILETSPFGHIDTKGVGELLKITIERGRQARPNIEIGICGEDGGDPKSIEFFDSIGLNYVSCSPFRVPIAKLAAAQSAVKRAQQ